MRVEIAATLISVAGTLAGTLLGVWLGGRISRQASQELLAQQAREEFAAAFVGVLVALDTKHDEESGFAVNLLQTYFPEHLAAYHKLRASLAPSDRLDLDGRWKIYTGDAQFELPTEKTFYRFADLGGPDSVVDQNALAVMHIHALLGMAD